MGLRVLSTRLCRGRGGVRGDDRTGPRRAPDRRPPSFRRVLRVVCERLKRAVEADDGSLGYVLERAGNVFGVSSRPGRSSDGGFERSPALDRYARPAGDRVVFVLTTRRLPVPIQLRRRTTRIAR